MCYFVYICVMAEREKLLNKTELCAILGRHPNTIYNYTKQGMPVHKKKGVHPYFVLSEVINWIKTKD